MRFLLGLLMGAAAVVAGAQVLTSLEAPWAQRAVAALQRTGLALEARWRAPAAAPRTEAASRTDVEVAPSAADAASAAAELPARQPLPKPPDPEGPPDGAVGSPQPAAVHAPDPAPAPSPPESGIARVWSPFHSEMSAAGFAERLSRSLDHPFSVERRGAGRYQVVFHYADEPEREALLAEAAAVTGLPL